MSRDRPKRDLDRFDYQIYSKTGKKVPIKKGRELEKMAAKIDELIGCIRNMNLIFYVIQLKYRKELVNCIV